MKQKPHSQQRIPVMLSLYKPDLDRMAALTQRSRLSRSELVRRLVKIAFYKQQTEQHHDK